MTSRAMPVLLAVTALASAAALRTPPAQAAFGDHALRQGDQGHDVRVLQRWLTLVGFDTATDGVFGRRTAVTVRRYERAQGQRVDGWFSRTQARGLRHRAYAVRASQPAPSAAAAPAATATLTPDGRTAIAPASAPPPVVAAIAAGNALIGKPYHYGGGHGDFEDSGYDCSGAVSYALHAAGLLSRPEDSTELMSFGQAGPGAWITIYAHRSHAYMSIAGLRLDTSGPGESGPRWRPEARSGRGFTVRHPDGL